ncbi:MAG: DNA repair protein RadA [Candidatus Tectomicrobia bacterium]|uniref:DNA repair protein RadA n=1 Tax=Tectimicrobiota bacterium TaxID=2528274 RepID=A0A937VZV6_UNCTE|nr:DNA repair protein RadA [Candidatus Tectomicrobia bacterium]
MSKTRSAFACQACGHHTTKWLGRCPDCGGWNTFAEEVQAPARPARQQGIVASNQLPLPLTEIARKGEERLLTGIDELDRVLGGGLVRGSLVLIGGDPGIGKSTLLLQATVGLSRGHTTEQHPVLYVSGEESAMQLRMRGDRLGVDSQHVYILTETSMELIREHVTRMQPRVLVIDSIQTIFTADITSAPGSVSQVRESTAHLMTLAKTLDVPILIIGHVTKEGTIAGPRVLEHMVDTVLYFEGERYHTYRVLRAVKNRFGPTNEIGMFEMRQTGFVEVKNPSALLLAERPQQASGSVVVASMEGTRPLLVELQALGSPSGLGMPRRVANGVDPQRLALLLAVLEKRFGFPLQNHDVYVNVVGGLYIEEPAIDLGVLVAVMSSLRDVALDPHLVVLGEVGLTGEVRAVGQVEARLREAAKLGFQRCLLPQANCQAMASIADIELCGVRTVAEALQAILPQGQARRDNTSEEAEDEEALVATPSRARLWGGQNRRPVGY